MDLWKIYCIYSLCSDNKLSGEREREREREKERKKERKKEREREF